MALGTALAIAGIGANLLGGLFGKKSATSAAQKQADAAAAAGKKVEDTVASTNPAVLQAAQVAGDAAKSTAATGSVDVKNTAEIAAQGVAGATTTANNLLNPYATASVTASDVLNKGIATGGDFNRNPTKEDIQIDPGFDFRYGDAVKDFENFAGAHGGVDNGGALKDFETLRQGLRSQEYQAAFDRFEKSTQNRYANVFGVSKQGQDASGKIGDNLISSGVYGGNVRNNASQFGANLLQRGQEYAGDQNVNATNLTTGRTNQGAGAAAEYATQGANAQAAGQVAGTNALWGGITGAIDAGTNAYNLNKYGLSGDSAKAGVHSVPATSPTRWTAPNIFRQRPQLIDPVRQAQGAY